MMSNLPPAIIFILGAILLPLLPRRFRSIGFLIFPLLAFVLLLHLQVGTTLTVPFLDYELVLCRVDRLSLAFGYIFVLISLLGGIYAFHLKDTGQQVATLLYAGSSLGVVFAGDLLTLFAFWEIMAVSSVCLIWLRRTPQSSGAGMRYLMVHMFGGAVLLAGILWHLEETGSILFNLLEDGVASYLILFGFALNAAIPPLHAWLADAYPEGTVTGTVFLSAFTTKVAVYALARGFAGFEPLIWAGVIMAVYGVVFALLENDIRRLLSYHIISQVGYMVAAIGIGSEMAINGATAHALNNILYKSLMFMGAGAVLHATGRSKLTELGGLARAMPITLVLYMIGAFSISGFPLFSGFVSKSMVISAAEHHGAEIVVLLLSLASIGSFASTGLKLPYFTWFGNNRSHKFTTVPRGMYLGMGLTAVCCIVIGFYPPLLHNLLPFTVDHQPYTPAHVVQTLQLLIFTGLGFWFIIKRLSIKATITLDTDWFYRRPSRLVYSLCVVSLSRLFTSAERATSRCIRFVARTSTNPSGYFIESIRSAKYVLLGTKQPNHKPGYKPFNPDRYRLPLGVTILMALAIFIIIIGWRLFTP